MDPRAFDALARSLGQAAPRRQLLPPVALGLVALARLSADTAARKRRHRDRQDVEADRKKKKRKHKKKCKVDCGSRICGPSNCPGVPCGACSGNTQCTADGKCACAPNCTGRQCGFDGCGGECTPGCTFGTTCNAKGQCVGCSALGDCPIVSCKQVACVNETCVYTNGPNDVPCLLQQDNICCGGACVNPQTDPAHCNGCGNACAPRGDTCINGECRCGANALCPEGATCDGGQCHCPGGTTYCPNECVASACCPVGKGCKVNENCCFHGNGPGLFSCGNDNHCCKNSGSTCNNGNECCSNSCTVNVCV